MLAKAPLGRMRARLHCYPPALRKASSYRIRQPRLISNTSHGRIALPVLLRASQWRAHALQQQLSNQRTFLSETAKTILTPPLVFVGLLLTLWTYKCIMMVLFQDKIIYMPNMPPFSRSEKLDEYTNECKPVVWEEQHIKSLDGTKLALAIGSIPGTTGLISDPVATREKKDKHVVICYFQGNGSSTPPRLSILSNVLKILNSKSLHSGKQVKYTLIALSYRGYWTSSGRASQSGIELDAQALLQYVARIHANQNSDVEVMLWGQSVGSGVATTAAAKYSAHQNLADPPITGLVLETPFSGIKSMLIALYPQKWLPYRYLWPFLWNHWDSESALRQLFSLEKRPRILLLPATRDEVVPAEEADKLESICKDVGLEYERKDVVGALHNEASVRRDGQQSMANFIANTTDQ